MGIVERKERDREEMRKLILSAAQKLFLANGYEKVSIRNIADEIEYSPATIYLYFRDKNELLFALHQRGFVQMVQEFRPLLLISDPFERLVEMGRSYIRFAVQNPELFDLMFIMNAPMDTLEKKDWVEGDQAFGLLVQVVQECMDTGVFRKHDVSATAMMIWSAIHGYTALFLRKRLGMFQECDRQVVMDDAFTLFCQTLRHGL